MATSSYRETSNEPLDPLVDQIARLEGLPEDRRVAGPAVWIERVAGDHADSRPPESRVQTLSVVAGHRVEHQQGLAFRASFGLGMLHEHLRNAALTWRAVDEEFAISPRCGWFGVSA